MGRKRSSPSSSTINQHFLHHIGSSTPASIVEIPDEFYKTFEKEENGRQTVALMSPPSLHKWSVKREGRKLTHGWMEFAMKHRVAAGDYVIFKHKGGSEFEVIIIGPSGSQLNKGNYETSKSGNQSGNQSTPKRQQEHGIRSEKKRRSVIGRQNVANPSSQMNISKKYKRTVPEEPNVLYQEVTNPNIKKNSVYIPKNFVNIHALPDKILEKMGFITKEGYVSEAIPRICGDGRIQIAGGWSDFCRDNNIKVGDRCKFILIEDAEYIVLELAGLSNKNKKPSERTNHSTPQYRCKAEQCSPGRIYKADNNIEPKITSVEDLFQWAKRELALEKGQSPRR